MFNRICELYKSMTELYKEYRELRSNFVKLKFFQDLLSVQKCYLIILKSWLFRTASKGEAGNPSLLYKFAPSGLSAQA
jgi:hypothetical protein